MGLKSQGLSARERNAQKKARVRLNAVFWQKPKSRKQTKLAGADKERDGCTRGNTELQPCGGAAKSHRITECFSKMTDPGDEGAGLGTAVPLVSEPLHLWEGGWLLRCCLRPPQLTWSFESFPQSCRTLECVATAIWKLCNADGRCFICRREDWSTDMARVSDEGLNSEDQSLTNAFPVPV